MGKRLKDDGSDIDISSHSRASSPFEEPLQMVVPVPFWRAVAILAICIIYIGALASLIIYFCSDLARNLGVDQSTLGATLVALGAEVGELSKTVEISEFKKTYACTDS